MICLKLEENLGKEKYKMLEDSNSYLFYTTTEVLC